MPTYKYHKVILIFRLYKMRGPSLEKMYNRRSTSKNRHLILDFLTLQKFRRVKHQRKHFQTQKLIYLRLQQQAGGAGTVLLPQSYRLQLLLFSVTYPVLKVYKYQVAYQGTRLTFYPLILLSLLLTVTLY